MANRTQQRNSGTSRRGFASMPRDEQRRIASMGGRASHGGRSRETDSEDLVNDDDDTRSRRNYRDYDEDDDHQSYQTRGSHRQDDEDDEQHYQSSRRDDDEDNTRVTRSRGYSMDRNEDRRSSGMTDRYSERSRPYNEDESEDRSSRRGFASMDQDERRRISSMGGRSSHGGSRSRR